ncbi:hypothetical protein [Arthrobacter sp. RIT-PI-e]|nr:hypothetical protein [Arthrobacter sp. RIT-PI-e]
MTNREEKDPPIPSFLEGIKLKQVHDGKVTEDDDDSAADDSKDI